MSFDYSVSEDEMQDDQTQTLRRPYNGPVDLVDLRFDDDPETFGDNDVIVFTFEALDEDHIGQQFEHIEWMPDQEDFGDDPDTDANGSTDFQIQMRRLVHMLPRLLAVDEQTIREDVVRFQGETTSDAWESLRKRVYQAYEKFGPSSEVESGNVHAKVFARENGGYVNVRFGKYPGFLRVVGEDPKLEFTNWERQRNREAQQFLREEPDGDDDFMAEDEDDFDFDDAEF